MVDVREPARDLEARILVHPRKATMPRPENVVAIVLAEGTKITPMVVEMTVTIVTVIVTVTATMIVTVPTENLKLVT